MYHCDLSIGLGGLLPEVRDVLTKVVPLEKFHHHYVISNFAHPKQACNNAQQGNVTP